MALSSLTAYGDSSSDEEEVGVQGGPPPPKRTPVIVTQRNKSGKVQIFIPQKPKLHDEDEITTAIDDRPRPKTGLAAVLPQPKKKRKLTAPVPVTSTTTLKRPATAGQTFTRSTLTLKKTKSIVEEIDEQDDDEEEIKSFLFLEDNDDDDDNDRNGNNKIISMDLPKINPPNYTTTSEAAPVPIMSSHDPINVEIPAAVEPTHNFPPPPPTTNTNNDESNLELNEDIICRLAGKKRGGHRRSEEAISMSQLKDVTEIGVKDAAVKSYQKYATEQSGQGSVAEQVGFTHLERRRHQITYLANQAKAREVELKNFWAESAAARRQTKMKYGF